MIVWLTRVALVGVAAILALSGWTLHDTLFAAPAQRELQRVADLSTELAALLERRSSLVGQLVALPLPPERSGQIENLVEPEASASLSLQRFVQQAVDGSGQIVSMQSAEEAVSADVTRVRLMLRGRLDELALLALLRRIEFGRPSLIVETLDVQPSRRNEALLEASMVISGLYSHAP